MSRKLMQPVADNNGEGPGRRETPLRRKFPQSEHLVRVVHPCSVIGACAIDGTTRQTKTHITEYREVYYRWHPCFGMSVGIKQGVNKVHGAIYRCVIDAKEFPSTMEIPKWMFDRATCALMVNKIKPSVSIHALLELQTLLQITTSSDDMLEDQRQSSRRKGNADENSSSSTSSESVKFVPSHREFAAVAITAAGITPECHPVDRPDVAPPSERQRRRRGVG